MTFAVAVEFSTVPASPPLMALEVDPLNGITVTRTAVPNGMLLALRFACTRLVVPGGRVRSGSS